MDSSRVVAAVTILRPWLNVLLLLQMVASAAAGALPEALPGLSCDAEALANGLFLYTLSEAVGSECQPSFEDHNKTAITVGSSVNETLVQNVTNKTLTLFKCLDKIHFNAMCPGTRFSLKTVCRLNCSSVPAPVVEPSWKICFSAGNCVDPEQVFVPVVVLVLVLVLVVAAFFYKLIKRRNNRYNLSKVGDPDETEAGGGEQFQMLQQDPPEEGALGDKRPLEDVIAM